MEKLYIKFGAAVGGGVSTDTFQKNLLCIVHEDQIKIYAFFSEKDPSYKNLHKA